MYLTQFSLKFRINVASCFSDGDDLSKGMCEKAEGSEDDSTQYDEYDRPTVPLLCMNNVVNEHQEIKAVGKHDTVSTFF
jgi:hypothetical protein